MIGNASAAPSPGRLQGRTVLLTGASRGIGRAIALRFAAEGAALCLVARGADGLEQVRAEVAALGAPAAVHAADLARREQVQAAFDAAIAAFGRVDVLVNNAGIYHAAPLVDTTPEDFDRVLQVNVCAAFHLMQLALRHMLARGSGKVLNIASTAGKWGSMNQSAYNASKHALVGLTRCAALEAAARGVQVNAICPGFVQTDMLDEFRAHAAILGVPFEQVLQAGVARVPQRRFLQPEEVANLALYLASAESDGMTGQSLLLDGGMLMV